METIRQPISLFDTSELSRPRIRKLHSALGELANIRTTVPPTVALELAPDGRATTAINGRSPAEHMLATQGPAIPHREQARLEINAWWAQVWRDPNSTYKIRTLTDDEQRLADEIAASLDAYCFKDTDPAFVAEHNDAKIVCEALVTEADILVTSNIRSIRHGRLNDWCEENGSKIGFTPRRPVQVADALLAERSKTPAERERLLKAALAACWPDDDNATPDELARTTVTVFRKMGDGRLPKSGPIIAGGIEQHPQPERLVAELQNSFPMATIETDRDHPAIPRRPSERWRGVRPAPPRPRARTW